MEITKIEKDVLYKQILKKLKTTDSMFNYKILNKIGIKNFNQQDFEEAFDFIVNEQPKNLVYIENDNIIVNQKYLNQHKNIKGLNNLIKIMIFMSKIGYSKNENMFKKVINKLISH